MRAFRIFILILLCLPVAVAAAAANGLPVFIDEWGPEGNGDGQIHKGRGITADRFERRHLHRRHAQSPRPAFRQHREFSWASGGSSGPHRASSTADRHRSRPRWPGLRRRLEQLPRPALPSQRHLHPPVRRQGARHPDSSRARSRSASVAMARSTSPIRSTAESSGSPPTASSCSSGAAPATRPVCSSTRSAASSPRTATYSSPTPARTASRNSAPPVRFSPVGAARTRSPE